MRSTLALGLTGILLAACTGGPGSTARPDTGHSRVCQEQADLARLGKVPSGEIAISCPAHGIGDYGQ